VPHVNCHRRREQNGLRRNAHQAQLVRSTGHLVRESAERRRPAPKARRRGESPHRAIVPRVGQPTRFLKYNVPHIRLAPYVVPRREHRDKSHSSVSERCATLGCASTAALRHQHASDFSHPSEALDTERYGWTFVSSSDVGLVLALLGPAKKTLAGRSCRF
jgi:hypothetical protein